MPHRAHLFSLRISHALRESLQHGYGFPQFFQDSLAGITVGLIAIPLAMALAIACGVAPQFGLYTAFIAGFLIPLLGGSRFSVSGPTAAFVVILQPLVQQYGLPGLLVASVLAGMILVVMAFLRLGRYIEYIPESVTLGFTMGIAVVIATLQVKDLLGLDAIFLPPHFVSKLGTLLQAVPDFSASTVFVGLATLGILWLWPRLNTSIPGHLPAVLVGSALAFVLIHVGHPVATVASTFHYLSADGAWSVGIPALLPDLQWPWARVQPGGSPLIFDWQVAQDLLSAAFAIAMLGAIESLLCAVVLDGFSGHKHSANSELLGQGIGNIITPFFGGITATAAIARSATNFKAGAHSPIAAMMHAVVVLMALMFFTRVLGHLPMASMAALLIMVAWNMSEAPKALRLIKTAPVSDVLVFVVCFSLTVLFDMVIAISTGIVLASLLFMKQMADMTKVQDITRNQKLVDLPVPEGWKVFKISGPLFFAAADRVFAELSILCRHQSGIILSLDGVSILDAGGVSALQGFIKSCTRHHTRLYLADFQYQPLKTLARARFLPDGQVCTLYSTLADALQALPNQGMPVAHGVSQEVVKPC